MLKTPITQPQYLSICCTRRQNQLGYLRKHPARSPKNLKALQIRCEGNEEKTDATKSLRKAQKHLKKSLKTISKELGEDEGMEKDAMDLVDPLWAEMYTAQKTLYEREMSRWDEERKMWDRREQGLLEEVRRLQCQVSTLMSASAGTAPIAGSSAEMVSAESISTSPEAGNTTGSVFTADAEEKMPEFLDGGKNQQEGQAPSVATSMFAAFAAVDQADVLSDDFTSTQQELEMKMGSSEIPLMDGTQSSVSNDVSLQPEGAPIETVKSPPTGPPPELAQGDDDIYWMSKLQSSLEERGFYCGDMDCEDFFFAEGTTDALLAFQASEGLAETGIADEDTWAILLGENGSKESPAPGASESERNESKPNHELGCEQTDSAVKPGFLVDSQEQGDVVSARSQSSSPLNIDPKLPKTKNGWPAIQENDGGKEVHQLHCCLSKHGYYCGEDDMNWWFYGSGTIDAIKTFQACNGLPESGTCTEKTWIAMLGEGAHPSDLDKMETGDSDDEDRAAQGEHSGGVWLLGEQRWEKMQ